MARSFSGAANNRLQTSTAPVTGPAFTMACWFKPSATANSGIMSLGDGNRHRRTLHINASSQVAAQTFDNAAAYTTTAAGTYSIGQWHHACAVHASIASRKVSLDGAFGSTNTTSQSLNSHADLFLGCLHGLSAGDPYEFEFTGDIFWPAVWNVVLTDAEVLSLAAGLNPVLVRPDSLVFFAPLGGLDGDHDNDIVGGFNLSASGSPTWSDDSPAGLIYPSTPQLVTAAAVGGGGGGSLPTSASLLGMLGEL